MHQSVNNKPVYLVRAMIVFAILAVGFGVFTLLVRTKPKAAPKDQQVAPPNVLVFEARRTPVQRQWRGFATVQAVDSADIPARVSAVVANLSQGADAGAVVKAGQLLVELDPSDFHRQVEIAQQGLTALAAQLNMLSVEQVRLHAQLALEKHDVALAQDELKRRRILELNNAATRKDIDDATRALILAQRNELAVQEDLDKHQFREAQLQAQIASQQASLKLAEQDLQRTRITSPIDGVLQSVDVELGEEVRPGMRLARVVNMAKLEAPLRLPASARSQIALDDQAVLSASGQSGLICQAPVKRIAPENDPATRTITVYVEINQAEMSNPNEQGFSHLAPGMFVTGTLTSQRSQMRWIVPRRSVRNGRIHLIRDGVMTSRAIKSAFSLEQRFEQFGLPDDQWIALQQTPDDLQPGDLIVVNATASLADGDGATPVIASAPQARRGATGQEIGP